jgi:hypothetical protein
MPCAGLRAARPCVFLAARCSGGSGRALCEARFCGGYFDAAPPRLTLRRVRCEPKPVAGIVREIVRKIAEVSIAKLEQISVRLEPDLRLFAEEAAKRDRRPLASCIWRGIGHLGIMPFGGLFD